MSCRAHSRPDKADPVAHWPRFSRGRQHAGRNAPPGGSRRPLRRRPPKAILYAKAVPRGKCPSFGLLGCVGWVSAASPTISYALVILVGLAASAHPTPLRPGGKLQVRHLLASGVQDIAAEMGLAVQAGDLEYQFVDALLELGLVAAVSAERIPLESRGSSITCRPLTNPSRAPTVRTERIALRSVGLVT